MYKFAFVLFVVCATGCVPSPSQREAAVAQQYIDSWDEMGMWLPDEYQIRYFRLHLDETKDALSAALCNPSYEVRMRSAYVIEKIGADARSLGPALSDRLRDEPDRLVRMYIYGALQSTELTQPETIEALKQRFASLDETKQVPKQGESDSDYLDADEKIHIAAALYVFDEEQHRKKYLQFILKWLRASDDEMTEEQRASLWDRRLGAVLSLKNLPDAAEAIPLLQSLEKEKDAPPWVWVHVPEVIASLK